MGNQTSDSEAQNTHSEIPINLTVEKNALLPDQADDDDALVDIIFDGDYSEDEKRVIKQEVHVGFSQGYHDGKSDRTMLYFTVEQSETPFSKGYILGFEEGCKDRNVLASDLYKRYVGIRELTVVAVENAITGQSVEQAPANEKDERTGTSVMKYLFGGAAVFGIGVGVGIFIGFQNGLKKGLEQRQVLEDLK